MGEETRYYDLDEQVYLDSVAGISEQYASSEFEEKTSYQTTHENGKYGLVRGTNRKTTVLPLSLRSNRLFESYSLRLYS